MSDPVAALFHTSGTNAPESVRSRARELSRFVAEGERLPLAPGDVVGHYEVLRVLGAGGQAVVYEAKDGRLGRHVALKVPRKDVGDRLAREAKVVAELAHPSIVQVLDLSLEGPVSFLVLELCHGSLDERLEAAHPDGLPLEDVHAIATSILEALAFAHERGVVHRDVKPGNVLFDAEGRAKVSDFGIGTIARADELSVSVELSNLSQLAGTPLYLAPEQENPALRVNGKLDGRADLFAFGKVLFQMLTGASPRTIRPPSRLRSSLGKKWDDYVFTLTEERPERRFATARDALECLPATPLSRAAESEKLQDKALERATAEVSPDHRPRLERLVEQAKAAALAMRVGPYRILSHREGEAGLITCRAVHVDTGQEVVLRRLSEQAAQGRKRCQRFLAAARAAMRVRSPHVVQVIDAGETASGIPYVVSEKVPGVTLADHLARHERLPWPEALRIVRDVARGLEALHGAGQRHQDVKPGNVIVTNDAARLDGLGKIFDAWEDVSLTSDGRFVGTPIYLAPEAARVRELDARADLYALGCTFYEMLTGVAPHAGMTFLELLAAKSRGTIAPPEARGAKLPEPLRRVLGKLLEKERDFRYPDAKHLLADLEAFDRGEPVSAREGSAWSPLIRPRRPRPWAVATLLLATAAAGVLVLSLTNHLPNDVPASIGLASAAILVAVPFLVTAARTRT